MTRHPKSEKELSEIRMELQSQQTDWSETLEELARAKEETYDGDFFATIDYLAFCDQLCKALYIDLKELDSQLKSFKDLRKRFREDEKHLNMMDDLLTEMQELHDQMQKKQENIDEEYPILAEQVLRRSQDLVSEFSEAQQQKFNLKNEINQNLEKELFVQELRDSLESYRQAREDLISELERDSIQKLPDNMILEDFGEENPEIDSILSQLDTAITACDMALLKKEIEG